MPEVAAVFRDRTLDEWLTVFKSLDACIEPVRDFSDVFNDPHVKHRGLIAQMDVPGIGTIPQIGSVFVFAPGPAAPPPRQGEHTRAVLEQIGVSDSELREMIQAGLIRTADK